MSLQNWPIEVVPVADLALDLTNVRIRVPQADEEAVMNYLYLSDEVDTLALDFLRDGYLDNELPVVVAGPDGKYVVMEGNRRVAALKGLLNPEAVPVKAAQLQRLLNRFAEAEVPTEIRVMIAPSVAAVQPLLARLHTQSSKRRWPRDQQAAFYYAQIQAGGSADSLRKLYSTSPAQINKFLKMATMLHAVRTMKIEDESLRDYVRGDKLNITAFEYVYLRLQIQAILKLDFNADGILQQKTLTEPQRKGLIFILQGVKTEAITTRTANLRTGTEANDKFLDDLRAAMGLAKRVPPAAGTDGAGTGTGAGTDSAGTASSQGESGTSGPGNGGAGSAGAGSGTAGGDTTSDGSGKGSRGPNSPATLKYLDLNGIDYSKLPHGLKQRYIELRKMDVQDLPNASFDVLRTVLECSIRVYCDAIGQPVPTGSQLGACLTHLGKQFPDKADRGIRNIINGLTNGKTEGSDEYFRSAEALNSSNHDPNIFVEGGHVHWAWEHMKPLLKRMAEPIKP